MAISNRALELPGCQGTWGRLLNRVGQLVGEQTSAFRRARRVLAGRKRDVPADGEGAGVQRAGGSGSLRARVDADVAEVAAKAGFEEGALARG